MSDAGRVQACAPPLAIGSDGSPPTMIMGDERIAVDTPGLDGDSGPNGLKGFDPAGFGGGTSLRETGGSEAAAGKLTAGI
jgi:hypothetical protein